MALLVGCGGVGGGTPTTNLVCRGDGVVVGGHVTFVKRLYDKQGLTGRRVVKPVRYALVEMVREVDGGIVASTYTDENGNYCVAVRSVPKEFPAVYPRVVSRTDPSRFRIAVVNDITIPPSFASLYSLTGAPFNGTIPGIYTRDLAVPVWAQLSGAPFPLAGAFNILDVATLGAETAIAIAGRAPSAQLLLGWTPGTPFGSGTVGTYFVADDPTQVADPTQQLAGIELSGGDGGGDPDSGDHDEFDDDVILHEYGHFMSYSFSKPAEAGGTHYLNDNTQDIRLAWSEGWATFFSAVARDLKDFPDSHAMVNTRGGDPGHPEQPFSYFFEIETPHSDLLSSINTPLETHGVYTTSEVAVSAVLWDLYDSSNESGDSFSLGASGVWGVFRQLVAAPANVSLDTFADYFARQFGMPNLAKTASLRQIQYSLDAFEASGDGEIGASVPEAIPGLPTCHTVFPEGDVDHVKILVSTPSRVTVETFNLSNGADTTLRLLDATGAEVLSNDNKATPRPFELTSCGNRRVQIPGFYFDEGINNGERLASKVGPVEVQPGTYFAVVTASGANPAAGKLGSYDLIVNLQ
ncbi:MAG: hypothetical protein ACOYXU_14720 [Nitrospirota bacterium]